MAEISLDSAIQRYKVALETLSQSTNPTINQVVTNQAAINQSAINQAVVLEVLTARDAVQTALEDASQTSGERLQELQDLDQRLKAQVSVIAPLTESTDWRASFNPKPTAWWWFLAAPQKGWTQFDWLWSAASITFLTIALGLLTDISTRFLKGGPDAFGAIAVSTQSILTLLTAGSALTKAGQEAGKRSLKGLKVPEPYWQEVGTGLSFLLLLGLVGVRQSLPQISAWYSQQGWKRYEAGDWGTAEENQKRSLELNPDNTLAHLRLGRLYEDIQKPDEARTQYRYAIGDKPAAVNNLARLTILKKDYSSAVSLLQKPLADEAKQPLPPDIKVALLKNLGWARWQQGHYDEAETQLESAIQVAKAAQLSPPKTASVYCLLAQVMEAQTKAAKETAGNRDRGSKAAPSPPALSAWKTCLRYGNSTIPEEDDWMMMAQQRVAAAELKP